MAKPKEIRWGIIGCGDVTEVKSGPAFYKIPQSKLVAVMRRDAFKVKDYARRHNVPRWYTGAKALIDDDEVNAVYIATPPDSHAQYTRMVAEAGKPVYVEKPMALNTAECQEMIAACQKADVPLFVAYYRRRLPHFLKVEELLKTQAIGEARAVSIRLILPPRPEDTTPSSNNWRVDPSISGGGYFHDLASHQLDILDYLLGPIRQASGYGSSLSNLYDADDVTSLSFAFESGIVGSGTWSFTSSAADNVDTIQIFGAEGSITFSAFNPNNPVVLNGAKGKKEFFLENPAHVQQPLIQTVVEELLGKGKCPSTGESALRTTKVLDSIGD